MKIVGVIPARFASTRFPGKPLVAIAGKTMIERVYRQCLQARGLYKVVVATDDRRIFDVVKNFGGEVWMTGSQHPTGTDRLIEISERIPGQDAYINIQGDEPFISPTQIDAVCQAFRTEKGIEIATLVRRIEDPADLTNGNVVKVVTTNSGYALYFSRSAIPYIRGVEDTSQWLAKYPFVKHIGIYGFTAPALGKIKMLKPGTIEQAESLEQLRWLENDMRVYTSMSTEPTYAIDTPADLENILLKIKNGELKA